MIEIALCIGIIGFALVAIIGVLPTGLKVQRDNREETIINHDAQFILNAIRSGGTGPDLDVLARNFDQIDVPGTSYTAPGGPGPNYFYTGSNIVGLMSRPGGGTTNYVRAFSGVLASQGTNPSARDLAFKYRISTDIDPIWVLVPKPGGGTRRATNSYEVRMRFRWPLLPNGSTGEGNKMFRTLVAARLDNNPPGSDQWFFTPQLFLP
jgi:type II secretory pathway pseudopilin PulG